MILIINGLEHYVTIAKPMISKSSLYSIIGHIQHYWDYTDSLPTGKPLEKLITDGLKSVYPDAKELGSPDTIVDVGKDKDAFDIKGIGKLSHSFRIPKDKFYIDNNYLKSELKNKSAYIKIPKFVTTMVRRPSVDIKSYGGDPKSIITEQIHEYNSFALNTTKKSGFENLYSLITLYGEDKGLRSVFISIDEFKIPTVSNFLTVYNKQNKPVGYSAMDDNERVMFSLSSFNNGSTNFYKSFKINTGVLYTWEIEKRPPVIYDYDYLTSNGSLMEL